MDKSPATYEEEIASLNRRNGALRLVLTMYDAAADKFLKKVETGKARSTETYSELRAARARSREAQSE